MEGVFVPNQWNRHHIWWERADYRRGLAKVFRNFAGNIVPVPISQHNLLHAELSPPLHPSRRQMLEAMDVLAGVPEHTEFTWGVEALRQYFLQEAQTLTSSEQATRALYTSEHLNLQIGYLALQKVG